LLLPLLSALAGSSSAQVSDASLTEIYAVEIFEPMYIDKTSLYGSSGGGTRLALLGNGLLNPDGSFDSSIAVFIAGRQAEVIPFLSSATRLVVETPAIPFSEADKSHEIQVSHEIQAWNLAPATGQDLRIVSLQLTMRP
jgi:hypothetical protein